VVVWLFVVVGTVVVGGAVLVVLPGALVEDVLVGLEPQADVEVVEGTGQTHGHTKFRFLLATEVAAEAEATPVAAEDPAAATAAELITTSCELTPGAGPVKVGEGAALTAAKSIA